MKKIIPILIIVIIAISGCSKDEKDKKNPKDKGKQEQSKEKENTSLNDLITSRNSQTMIIFDASGSMWGLIDGIKKLDIAKNAIKELTKNLNNKHIGLMTYGSKRNSDCNDIEVLSEPKKNNSENISKLLDKISPKGRTPIASSIQKATDTLHSKEIPSNIILVSDGEESCGANLCEFAKKIKKETKELKINVIAFDVELSKTNGLKCLADETGGKFLVAKNQKELIQALNKTANIKIPKPQIKKEVSDENIVKLKLLGKNEVKNKMTISWNGPNESMDLIAVVPKNSSDFEKNIFTINNLASKGGISKIYIPTKKGEYDIVYWHGQKRILARKTFSVEKTIADISIKSEAEIGEEISVTWIGPNKKNDIIAIINHGLTSYNEKYDMIPNLDKKTGVANIILPYESGIYDIVYMDSQKYILARKTIKVKNVIVKFNKRKEKAVVGEMIDISWVGPNRQKDIIALMPYGYRTGKKLSESLVKISAKNGSGMLMAPNKRGYYYLTYWLNGEKKIYSEKIYIYAKK